MRPATCPKPCTPPIEPFAQFVVANHRPTLHRMSTFVSFPETALHYFSCLDSSISLYPSCLASSLVIRYLIAFRHIRAQKGIRTLHHYMLQHVIIYKITNLRRRCGLSLRIARVTLLFELQRRFHSRRPQGRVSCSTFIVPIISVRFFIVPLSAGIQTAVVPIRQSHAQILLPLPFSNRSRVQCHRIRNWPWLGFSWNRRGEAGLPKSKRTK